MSATPALWDLLPPAFGPGNLENLEVLALGGAPFPHRHIRGWALGAQGLQGLQWPTCRGAQEGSGAGEGGGGGVPQRLRVLNTYGVTEATVYQTICEVREVLCIPLQPLSAYPCNPCITWQPSYLAYRLVLLKRRCTFSNAVHLQ